MGQDLFLQQRKQADATSVTGSWFLTDSESCPSPEHSGSHWVSLLCLLTEVVEALVLRSPYKDRLSAQYHTDGNTTKANNSNKL